MQALRAQLCRAAGPAWRPAPCWPLGQTRSLVTSTQAWLSTTSRVRPLLLAEPGSVFFGLPPPCVLQPSVPLAPSSQPGTLHQPSHQQTTAHTTRCAWHSQPGTLQQCQVHSADPAPACCQVYSIQGLCSDGTSTTDLVSLPLDGACGSSFTRGKTTLVTSGSMPPAFWNVYFRCQHASWCAGAGVVCADACDAQGP